MVPMVGTDRNPIILERGIMQKITTPICTHRGEPVKSVDCGCNGTATVYECAKHGNCSIRKMPKGDFKNIAICLGCEDAETYQSAQVGFANVCANEVGGVETWLRNLVPHLNVSGVATFDRPRIAGLPVPVLHGAFEELADNSQIVFVWGITQPLPRGPKYIAIHHGDMRGEWANQVFRKQMRWCDGAVAVNRDVARYYKVPYLPNPVVEPANVPPAYSPFNKTVLWCHRNSSEKHPEKAVAIAKALPEGWGIIMTAEGPPAKNVHYVGKVLDPSALYAAADVFLSTSDQEAFGYSCAQAILSNIPVVSTPYGLAGEHCDELNCDLEAPVEDWVYAIVNSYRIVPAFERSLKSSAIRHYYQENAIDSWREFIRQKETPEC